MTADKQLCRNQNCNNRLCSLTRKGTTSCYLNSNQSKFKSEMRCGTFLMVLISHWYTLLRVVVAPHTSKSQVYSGGSFPQGRKTKKKLHL